MEVRTLKFKERAENIKEKFAKKTIRQKIRFCIGLTLLLIFLFFIIKGNTYDLWVGGNTQSQAENVVPGSSDNSDSSTESLPPNKAPTFKINWLDAAILAALGTAYGVHKYRENKQNRR